MVTLRESNKLLWSLTSMTCFLQSLEQISSLRTVAGEGWSEYVDDAKMLALLTACGSADRPVDLAVLLRELERRKRHMPCAVLPTKPDSAGRPVSALTSWLPSVAADDDKKSELPAPVSEDPMFIGMCFQCPVLSGLA